MAANVAYGWDMRSMNIPRTIKEFVVGHLNLLRKKKASSRETFAIGRQILASLDGKAGSLDCASITGKTFVGWDDFQAHMRASTACRELIEQATRVSSEAITRYRPL